MILTGATWQLFSDDVAIDSGDCIVDGASFMALIEPKEIGDFVLEVKYTVAPEVRKVRVAIHVS